MVVWCFTHEGTERVTAPLNVAYLIDGKGFWSETAVSLALSMPVPSGG